MKRDGNTSSLFILSKISERERAMNNYYAIRYDDSYLAHHGILGMRWGVRRYQNADGSLTAAGRNRYGIKSTKEYKNERIEKYKKEGYNKLTARTKANEDVSYAKKAYRMANSGAKDREKLTQQLKEGKLSSSQFGKKFIKARTKEYSGLIYASMTDKMASKYAAYTRAVVLASGIGQASFGFLGNVAATSITSLAMRKLTGVGEVDEKVRRDALAMAERDFNKLYRMALEDYNKEKLKGN